MRLRLPPLPDKNGIQISILIIPAEGTRPTNVKILSSLVESLSMCAIRWWYITFQWTNSDLILSVNASHQTSYLASALPLNKSQSEGLHLLASTVNADIGGELQSIY